MTRISKCYQLSRSTIYKHGVSYWILLIIVAVCLPPHVQSENCEPSNGTWQSPINIENSNVVFRGRTKTPVTFSEGYSKPKTYSLENTGHTIQLNGLPEYGMEVSGGIIKGSYKFRQLHFHLPSEHTVNNKSYPMELHVVHEQTANKSIDQYVVFGYGFQIGKDDNPGLMKIIDAIPTIANKKESTKIEDFTLKDLIGSPPKPYLAYAGSLTTFPYTESVLWILKLSPLIISQKQIDVFYLAAMKTPGLVNNNRCIQKLNRRKVYLYK